MLRYLSDNTETVEHCDASAEVVFNYLGQFDQTLSESSLFKWLKSPAGKRTACETAAALLNVNGFVVNGCLQLN